VSQWSLLEDLRSRADLGELGDAVDDGNVTAGWVVGRPTYPSSDVLELASQTLVEPSPSALPRLDNKALALTQAFKPKDIR